MLLLVFQIGDERFALDTGPVLEVVPRVPLRPIPEAPAAIPGVFQYRSRVVPVIDLAQLMYARPSVAALSTRIIVLRYPDAAGEHLLGLVAERLLDTLDRAPSEFRPTGVAVPQAPYLGPVTDVDGTLVQLVTVAELVPAEVRALLFTDSGIKDERPVTD